MQLKPNTLLKGGEFRIIKFLGHGGFGMTYLAEQISLNNRKVCIKEFFPRDYYRREGDTHRAVAISENFAKDMEVYKQKFYKEATTIASFNHNNIVKIYDVFRENDTVYYAMEYIDGCSLRDMIADKRPLSKGRALKYVRETAKALAHIHKQDHVHLDIKPANIMVREDDDSVVVIDFGLSKHFNEDGSPTSTTPGGFSRGYSPLEMYQTQKERKFLPPTDIYSLGATLYALLTGEEPVEASDISLYGVPKHDRLDATMHAFISRAMSPNPDNRPQSIEEFTKLLGAKSKAETDNGDTVLEKSGFFIKKEKPANSKPSIELNIKKAVNSHFAEAGKAGIIINTNKREVIVTNIFINGKKAFSIKSSAKCIGEYRVYDNSELIVEALTKLSQTNKNVILPGNKHIFGNNPEAVIDTINNVIKSIVPQLNVTSISQECYAQKRNSIGYYAMEFLKTILLPVLFSMGIAGILAESISGNIFAIISNCTLMLTPILALIIKWIFDHKYTTSFTEKLLRVLTIFGLTYCFIGAIGTAKNLPYEVYANNFGFGDTFEQGECGCYFTEDEDIENYIENYVNDKIAPYNNDIPTSHYILTYAIIIAAYYIGQTIIRRRHTNTFGISFKLLVIVGLLILTILILTATYCDINLSTKNFRIYVEYYLWDKDIDIYVNKLFTEISDELLWIIYLPMVLQMFVFACIDKPRKLLSK